MSTMLEESSAWMTAQEVAEQLGITEGRVRQLLLNGSLKGTKFGNSWAIRREECERFSRLSREPGNPNFRKSEKQH